jgi:cell fate regulator YaaT (PSP1 superfamily)
MAQVVGVRFKTAGKVYYFDPGELDLRPGDGVVVETARGMELGTVAGAPREVAEEEVKPPLKKVVRKADPQDLARRQENEEKARRAFSVGQQKIAVRGLPMKLVHVEYTLDGSKIIFYFTAENRVDFRELVKDLASAFRTRIELRQIGVRDEAKLLGGLGPCGRQLCCQAFLGDFVPVSIRMAKEQNLSLNPTKISGICGRLMCCLNYECEAYREARKTAKQAKETPEAKDPAEESRAEEAAQTETAGPEAPVAAPAPGAQGQSALGGAPGGSPEQRLKGRRRRHRHPGGAELAASPDKPGGPRPSQPNQRSDRRRRRRPKGGEAGSSPGHPGGNQGGSPTG